MTAVGLLFATYMVKPSPFCLLDEIDAALDEANVLRFVQVLREFGNSSQFIVITHNKKTVTGAQTLLGVTMEEFGVTKVIAVRLENEGLAGPDPLADTEPWVEEEVEQETGCELPPGIDDPSKVDEATLRPLRAGRRRQEERLGSSVPDEPLSVEEALPDTSEEPLLLADGEAMAEDSATQDTDMVGEDMPVSSDPVVGDSPLAD